ncbi:hypothetical protein JTE90_013410 [Oedothorax gibbosus]|uniref:Hexosyltransferase n=1 Tax=Oedothorax gibbosus TaxID=931172 RepID=A0AAV6TW79_9ARAC|nr:hypothetical protein JTE90_013410 [Oedothorax gibbosus]
MLSYLSTSVCVIIALITLFYQDHVMQMWKKSFSVEDKIVLAVGILSSREHFEEREAVRSTWQFSSNYATVRAWFIVGESSCHLPPEYRLSAYGCEKWNINVSGLQDKFYASKEKSMENCFLDEERKFYQGFSFKVNHPVVVTKLGVFANIVLKNSSAKVAIMDVQNKEVIVETVISSEKLHGHGYIYAEVEPLLLPKDYEGLVLVEGYLKDTACVETIWDDGGGVITFKRVYSSHHHLDSKKYSSDFSIAAGVMFYVPELQKLKELAEKEVEATEKWLVHLEELNKRLRMEMEDFGDIVVVDVVDTYRSLPAKLLKFYQWLASSYKFLYVMKTDDDSVINVSQILQKLQEKGKFNPERFWIWSRFRKNWPVNYIGKWTDYEYQSSYYPSFPCGAAYVMSYQIVHWLVSNAERLFTYQGEDVSIGIWLTAINAELIEDENFVCDTSCNFKSYNQAQVTANQMYKVWANLKRCNNFCSCVNQDITN